MLAERVIADELMDDPSLDPRVYTRVLGDLSQVNTVTLARRLTLNFVTRAVGNRDSFRLLDVGFGDGDMLRAISRWAEKREIEAQLVGVDLNPGSMAAAEAATPGASGIHYFIGDYAELAGQNWDIVISNLVAHHMTRDQLVGFLRFMDAEARAGWFINDLHRHGFAYTAWPLLAAAMGWHPIVRSDGRLSIARSYRPSEWPPILAEAGVTGARVFRAFPFRLCVERLR